jgi:hypothetical protein
MQAAILVLLIVQVWRAPFWAGLYLLTQCSFGLRKGDFCTPARAAHKAPAAPPSRPDAL